MDLQEQFVMWNLLSRVPSELFICPQFQIKGRRGKCPDFVALNLRKREVWIVEVSGAYTVAKLASKIQDRERYIAAVREQLAEVADWLADWKYSLEVFVRKDAKPAIPGARFLEDLKFPWHDWGKKLDES